MFRDRFTPVRFGHVDESIHDSAGLYVVAPVSAVPSPADQVRGVLAACVPAVRHLHWHGEDEATKYALVRAVATLPIEAKVYGCRFAARGRQEAARARALGWAVTACRQASLCCGFPTSLWGRPRPI
ncbi:hypothetical protein [Streptosporangium sp. NPDC004631]